MLLKKFKGESPEERIARWEKQYPHLMQYLDGDPQHIYMVPTLENICKELEKCKRD